MLKYVDRTERSLIHSEPIRSRALVAVPGAGAELHRADADADRCRVLVDSNPDTLALEVTDSGAGTRPATGTGHGIAGMRERVGMYGGQFQAGPGPGRGFRVAARFPLAGAAR
jgi:signal transduction histidine kinase